MSRQTWLDYKGVRLDWNLFIHLQDEFLDIIVEPDGYPWVVCQVLICPACSSLSCDCSRPIKKLTLLHHYAWEFFNPDAPRAQDEVIHHRNGIKTDARLKNLKKLSPKQHALAHNAKKRKYSRRPRTNFGGFRFRPRQPARIQERPDLVGQTRPASPAAAARVPTMQERVIDMERRLAVKLPSLQEALTYLDSKTPIPRGSPKSAWREPKTRRLGLKMPAMCCLEGEAAFVLFLIMDDFDLDQVATDAGEPKELLAKLFERPSVSQAISRWRKYRRLPAPGRLTWRRG